VKVFVSIGAVGSWFCNWVISNERKLLKLLPKEPSALVEAEAEVVALLAGAVDDAVKVVGSVVLATVMIWSPFRL
jgi:hypothetical protein